MKKSLFTISLLISPIVSSAIYETPVCYLNVPTSCGFNEMTLMLCNEAGKKNNQTFTLSSRSYMPGGNKFATKNSSAFCTVKGIKGTDPKQYKVTIK